jgi:enoyl-CoA hydratase
MTAERDPIVLVEQRGPVRIVTMNRPHVLNALNVELELAVFAAVDEADRDPGTRAVVLCGNGRAFSAGADLKERASESVVDLDAEIREFRAHSTFMRVVAMDTPVIAAVHGYCLGGAFQLAGLCDITIVGASARLGEPEVRFANPLLVPITPHLVGLKQARKLLYLGSAVDAHEAVALDIASEVVDDDVLLERATEVAEDIAGVPPEALRVVSRATRYASEARGVEREALVNAEILVLTLEAQRARASGEAFLEAVRTSGAGKAAALLPHVGAADRERVADLVSSAMTTSSGDDRPMEPVPDPAWEFVHLARNGSASVITFDRPRVLNAMNRQLLSEFDAAFAQALADPSSRAIVLRGEGRAFSAGMDLKEPDLKPLPVDGQRTHLAGLLERAMRIFESDKPVIAAVQGHCLGHACDLAAAADFTIAGSSARFGVPEVRHLGGVAAMVYPYLMPQKRLRDFLYRGRSLDADAARSCGLVTDVVPDEEVLTAALTLAEELATIPIEGLRQMKRAINRSIDGMGLRGTLAYNLESLALVLNAQSPAELAEREHLIKESGLGAFLHERDRATVVDPHEETHG